MSKYEYPPTSGDTTTINQLLQIYSTIIEDDKNSIYISTPMTSGLLYMKAFAELSDNEKEKGLTPETRNAFFNQNCQHASYVAAIARLHFSSSVIINPTKIEVKGWEQNDYLTFWRQVILDYVKIVIFVEDWHYSNGCAYEFLIGVVGDKVMTDEYGNIIHPKKGRELIEKAYNEHLVNGYDNTFLKDVIKSLDEKIEQWQ